MYVFFMLRKKLLNGSHSNVQEKNYAVLKTDAWKKILFDACITSNFRNKTICQSIKYGFIYFKISI